MKLASALRGQSHHLIWLLAGTMLSGAPALAQTAPEAEAAVDDGAIVVTARKRSESIQDVPFAIQAFSAAKLEENQVQSFDDYAKLLPSVSFQSFGPGQSQIYFRGVSSGANANGSHSGPQPTSALYVDEVPLTTIGGAPDLHIYDMERVEALSGPQGTLFGASSLSGTLRLITKKPDVNKTEFGIDVTGTTFGKGDNSSGGTIEAFFNVPLHPHAALRVSAFYERDGGFISNVPGSRTYQIETDDGEGGTTLVNFGPVTNARFVKKNFNDTETAGGRAALGIDLDSGWTATPAIIYQKQKSHGTYLYDPKVGDLKVQDFTPDYGSDEWYQAMLTIHGKLGTWDVTYAGGYFERDTDLFQDYSSYTLAYDQFAPYYVSFFNQDGSILDPTQSYRGRDHYTKHSQELRISSPEGGRWRLTAGLFFERQTDKISADYFIPGLEATGMGVTVPNCATDDIFCTRVNRIDRDYAGFVDGSFDLTPSLTLSGGIRYFITRNSLAGFSGFGSAVGTASCPVTSDPFLPCLLFDKTVREDGETHKANLTWKFRPGAMAYFTYSTGFRPGGINRRVGVNPYKSDTLDNFEVGLKTQLFDRMLTLNVAAFYENWKDLQYGLTSAGAVGVISTYNAGTAHIKGVEGDFALRAGPVTFSGSATYIDAKLVTAFCPIAANGNPDCSDPTTVAAPIGTPLPIQPKFKGNLSARYVFPVGRVDAYAQASVSHQSGSRSYLTDVEANLLGNTSGFTTVDFSLGGKLGNYSFEAFIQNAFDERGILSLNTACVPTICGAYARAYPVKPATFGLKLSARY
jgi:outer membrane receptor protein involved in Fe transport